MFKLFTAIEIAIEIACGFEDKDKKEEVDEKKWMVNADYSESFYTFAIRMNSRMRLISIFFDG